MKKKKKKDSVRISQSVQFEFFGLILLFMPKLYLITIIFFSDLYQIGVASNIISFLL